MVSVRQFITAAIVGAGIAEAIPFPAKSGLQLRQDMDVFDSAVKASDDKIVEELVKQLTILHDNKNLTDCEKCLNKLTIGKTLSLTRPDLVPTVFSKWCIDTRFLAEDSCMTLYHRNTVESSFRGTNFADMLSLLDPNSYDGYLFCHYYESRRCPKPETPNTTLSHLWPAKQPKHYIAPEPDKDDLINVLHVSDFHIQLDYTVGSETNCTSGMCCSPDSINMFSTRGNRRYDGDWNSYYGSYYTDGGRFIKGTYNDPFLNQTVWTPATTFGHYSCDAPEILINSSLYSVIDYANDQNMCFEFAIFTGDLVDHHELKYVDYESVVESEVTIFRDIKSRLGTVPLYSVLGNHDTFPYGQLAPEGYGFSNRFSWNAELMADLWEDYGWLDKETAMYAKHHYTGFAVNTKIGLKIISLNSNVWFRKNNYAYLNASDADAFGQLKFLVDELVESESKDQRVWVIAHIPFGTDSLPAPSNLFAEIVERFSPYTIAGLFFGHTHLDQFDVLYAGSGADAKTIENVVNVAWIAPAVTPWIGNNPAWRYYTVDRKTFSIMNSHNFYTQLNNTFNNDGSEPVWEFEYDARSAYGITDWPESAPLNGSYWHKVATKMRDDPASMQLYENYSRRFSPYVRNCTSSLCDNHYCRVTSFTIDRYEDCISDTGEPDFD
ncbi:uncharacterized protein Ecym_4748 [Eremothecium cymbalariae DBVPG|uniref:Uncharacterized protein n=1 Tax=Eremothecium cymbalariae (strain CBS 270.75 / DBVPG 7215 / KCTC 17166 / NRRL Y-17582) TaxID=931890 RepID=G8JSP1_ERECY|nr:hypothetical protein Ecym_4748 [Eremothecium cymbalariae DBVPG\